MPLAQGFMSNVSFLVRPSAASDRLVDAVRREIRAVAPGLPLFSVRTFKAHVAGSPEYWALTMCSSMFAFLAASRWWWRSSASTGHGLRRRSPYPGNRRADGDRRRAAQVLA